jgi:TIR domain
VTGTAHVFVSYSHKDRSYVDALVAFMRSVDIAVWTDHGIGPGARWEHEIEKQIRDCAAFVPVMSASSKAARWVKREVRLAQTLDKPILPLLLEKGQRFRTLRHLNDEDVTLGHMPSHLYVNNLRAVVSARFPDACPVCGARLGATAPIDPGSGRFTEVPAFRLEICAPDSARPVLDPAWRLGIVGSSFPPAVSTDPPFNEETVDVIYRLCGEGHIFLDVARDGTEQHTDVWNMITTAGNPAGGRTYLLTRTLHQPLNHKDLDPHGSRTRVPEHALSEQALLSARATTYARTPSSGEVMPETSAMGKPRDMLDAYFPNVYGAVRSLIERTVRNGMQCAHNWGVGIRSPLVLRTDMWGRHGWTGVLDPPGELFAPDPYGINWEAEGGTLVRVREHDAALWVFDSAVAPGLMDRLVDDTSITDADLLGGSTRPGTILSSWDFVRDIRADVDHAVGRRLAVIEGSRTTGHGSSLTMMVAVTKCDLIHATLRAGSLNDLGKPGVVLRGAAAFLAFLASRFDQYVTDADATSTMVMEHVRAESGYDIAQDLLRHYSDPDAFWNLVHLGERETIRIAGSNGSLEVPSLDEHLDACLRPGSGHRILARDLVMSSVGCGVAHGLGHEDSLYGLLHKPWQDLRFFLCSPLGTVPVAVERDLLAPLDASARFPELEERSAGLTQLLLAMLKKVRA